MANTNSNSIWVDADCYDGFELSRPQLFREETRDLFFRYFRIKPSDNVIDGGCGTGVLTRFIAKGLTSGTITGFDISKNFVEYGNKRIDEEKLSDKAKIVLDDGFALSFPDNTFDAVVNHNYLGVLSDPAAGLRELIRVCKPGGNISVSSGTSASTGTGMGSGQFWAGEYPLEGMERLKELMDKYNQAYKRIVTTSALKQSHEWPSGRFPKLFSVCGLTNISIMPVGAAFAYNDNYWSDEYRVKKITLDINDEIRIITENNKDPKFSENGFSNKDCDELVELLQRKQNYLLENYRTDDSWEWSAGLNCIVTGTKPFLD
ncbi:MAG: methyltransferase domain-containing protein [Oscillospiraceae bacterium]|jgi:ubiquinone/menaquinone biosynthesis C-methylase UbiE|nr:methyltransferase domain-containing protein [Oscillospiraceae bacterium]